MAGLPFSKELLPLSSTSPIPRVPEEPARLAIDNTLETLTLAGINESCVVIAPGKWDIPAHTGNGGRYGQRIAYVVAEASPSVPASLDEAWFLTRGREVALLFPDIVFEPKRALREVVDNRRQVDADLVLALVPAASGEKIEIVSVSDSGLVEKVTPKPGRDNHGWTWVTAAWNSRFGNFLHDILPTAHEITDRELFVADVINAAIDAKFQVNALKYPDGNSFDLGTPEELTSYWQSTFA